MRLFAAFATSLALLTSLPAAAAPAKTAPATRAAPASGAGFELKDVSVSGWIGGEFGNLDGVYLRADASVPVMALTDKVKLLGVASLGFTHLGMDVPYGSISWNMVKLLASGRVQMNVAPKLDVFADGGLGFYVGGWSSEVNTPAIPPFIPAMTVKADDTTGGFTMRFAAGGFYEVAPKLQVGAELGFNPYFGDADTTNFFIGVGAAYKL
jgi:hypothetical protein